MPQITQPPFPQVTAASAAAVLVRSFVLAWNPDSGSSGAGRRSGML